MKERKLFLIDKEDIQKLEEISRKTGLSQSSLIRIILKRELEYLSKVFNVRSEDKNNKKEEGKYGEFAVNNSLVKQIPFLKNEGRDEERHGGIQ